MGGGMDFDDPLPIQQEVVDEDRWGWIRPDLHQAIMRNIGMWLTINTAFGGSWLLSLFLDMLKPISSMVGLIALIVFLATSGAAAWTIMSISTYYRRFGQLPP